jgi:hypothetical protein
LPEGKSAMPVVDPASTQADWTETWERFWFIDEPGKATSYRPQSPVVKCGNLECGLCYERAGTASVGPPPAVPEKAFSVCVPLGGSVTLEVRAVARPAPTAPAPKCAEPCDKDD